MTTLQRLLERAVEREQLVGAQLTVLRGGVATSAFAGERDVTTGHRVSAGTAFEIGSVTKPLVAAALLLAQDDGQVDLDAPVATAVPEFRPVAPAAQAVTARQVLSHTSGLAGDYFPDTGDGADAITRFVRLLAQQPLDVEPGTTVSYSNAAYVLAGRLLECVVGRPFDEAVAQRLLQPAGADGVTTWNAPPADLARGHELGGDGRAARALRRFPRALTPAGGLVASAPHLAQLVRALTVTAGGRLPSWLPERSRERLAEVADRPGASLGWGWVVSTSQGEPLLAHDGGTFGASSYVRVLPDRDLVVVLLTARAGVGAAGQVLLDAALEALGHPALEAPQAPAEVAGAVRQPAAVVGRYRRTGGSVEVDARAEELWCAVSSDGTDAPVEGPLELQPSGTWHAHTASGTVPLVFLGDDDCATCVVTGVRAHTRVSPPPAPVPDARR